MFPNNFLWGAATSAFQYEGANLEDGKGWSVADERCKNRAINHPQADASVASDGYHKLQEDVELMKELGIKSYRFSIGWSRLYPKGYGELNTDGLKYYDKLIDALVNNGIEPVVTLLHFDIPWNLIEEMEGFVDRRCVEYFEQFAKTCFEQFGDRVKYWLTINEQNVMSSMPSMCGLKEDETIQKKLVQANYNMFLASAKAVKACHDLCKEAKIGPCVSYPTFYPATCNPLDVEAAYLNMDLFCYYAMEVYVHGEYPKYILNKWEEDGVMPERKEEDATILKDGCADYLGLNWYTTQCVCAKSEGNLLNIGDKMDIVPNPYLKATEWGWNYDPKGLRIALRECYARFRLPLMICENGWSQQEELTDGKVHDEVRIQYIKEHVETMSKAIDDGVDLIGYQYWSFVDILSSSQGFAKRYGLVYVDRGEENTCDCKRYPKDSFYYYKKLIQTNGKGI